VRGFSWALESLLGAPALKWLVVFFRRRAGLFRPTPPPDHPIGYHAMGGREGEWDGTVQRR